MADLVPAGEPTPTDVLERVVCGIDGSESGLEAARQAGRFASGRLTLVAAFSGSDAAERMGRALTGAQAAVSTAASLESRLVDGWPVPVLIREIERARATAVVVGAHTRSRVAGIALGSVATTVVHRAPCSVLIARVPTQRQAPASFVVGVDGSDASAMALEIASLLGRRLGVDVRAVLAAGGKGVDLEAAREAAGGRELHVLNGAPVPELIGAATGDDLLVVGSRGLQGLRAVGSVSERVAHRAGCSVLIVRPAVRAAPRSARQILVGEIMSAPAIVALEETPLAEIASLMLDNGIGAIPIVDEEGRIAGIITEADFVGREAVMATTRHGEILRVPKLLGEWMLRDKLEEIYRDSKRMAAKDAMASPVVVASENEPVQQVVERMLHQRVSRLPVVREGVPVGVVSRRDVLRVAAEIWNAEADEAERLAAGHESS